MINLFLNMAFYRNANTDQMLQCVMRKKKSQPAGCYALTCVIGRIKPANLCIGYFLAVRRFAFVGRPKQIRLPKA